MIPNEIPGEAFEVARTQGIVIAGMHQGKLFQHFKKLEDSEWALLEKVQPFVFSTQEPLDMRIPEDELERMRKDPRTASIGFDTYSDLDAPFPVFSIELLGGPIDEFNTTDGIGKTLCIIVVEAAPKTYGYYALSTDPESGGYVLHKSNAEGKSVKHFLDRLNKEQIGTEFVRTAVKLGSGAHKKIVRIRKIIHVTPKRSMSNYGTSIGRTVDWSHRWEVRGHWRKLDGGLGKDRSGIYNTQGFTWVSHHEKGPEHLPIVHKTRLVKEPVEQQSREYFEV